MSAWLSCRFALEIATGSGRPDQVKTRLAVLSSVGRSRSQMAKS